jgi:LPS-assembly protein
VPPLCIPPIFAALRQPLRAVCWLAWACASAAAWGQTPAPSTLEADTLQGSPDVQTTATGHVDFQQAGRRILADRLRYDQRSDRARASGNVKLTSEGNWFSGPELDIGVQSLEGYFLSPTYFIGKTQSGGSASRWDFAGPEHAVAHDITYTSCPIPPAGDPDWLLKADKIELDFATNTGTAHGAVLRFYGLPILGAPVLSFPLSDARKSGWLPMAASSDNKSGFQLVVPYYWNIAPNIDAKTAPLLSTRRGLGFETDLRYLAPDFSGKLTLHSLPHDALTQQSRGSLAFTHQGHFLDNFRYNADILRATDDDYWKDFSRHVPSPTPRLLDAKLSAIFEGDTWAAYAQTRRWQVLQTLDPSTQIDAPYDRLPQIGMRSSQPLGFGVQWGLEAEFNRFTNPDGYRRDAPLSSAQSALGNPERPTGNRTHATASLSWPSLHPGWSLTPKFALNWAQYDLDQPLTSGPYQNHRQAVRTIPSFSLDNAWTFERETTWRGRAVRQTLEPRMLYVHTPYRAQAGLPLFDTAPQDFNVDSIYSGNIFSGIDRISDARQLTAGLTTRFLSADSGVESARFGVAQRFLFHPQRITPDDGPTANQSASDLLLFGASTLSKRWTLDAAVQHSYELGRTVRSTLGARYSPGPYRTLSLAYRLKRSESEQVNLAWQWPVYGPRRSDAGNSACRGTWYSAGRVNYSLRESRITDSVLALEYDSSCWVGRILAKRLSTSKSQATTQFGIEVEFIGLSRLSVLNSPSKVLRDNVPGYLPLRKETPE